MTAFLLMVVIAYLLGSIPFGLVVAKLMGGPDPRLAGSANIGAANVYRVLGRNAGAFTLFGDIMKGAVPVFLARFGLQGLPAGMRPPWPRWVWPRSADISGPFTWDLRAAKPWPPVSELYWLSRPWPPWLCWGFMAWSFGCGAYLRWRLWLRPGRCPSR